MRIINVIIALCIGTACGAWITYNSEKYMANDFSRTSTLLHSVPLKNYQVALFGNSVLVNGVNTKNLNLAAYNFGSSGQLLAESALYYQLLPENVHHVIQYVDVSTLLNGNSCELKREVILQFRSNGYVPSRFTTTLFEDSFAEVPLDEKLSFQRNKFQGGVNTMLRYIVKPSQNANIQDLHNPFQYVQNLPKKQKSRLIAIHSPKNPIHTFTPNFDVVTILQKLSAYLQERDVRYTVVILPVHPEMKNYTDDFFSKLATYPFSEYGLKVHDFTQLLDAEDFIDHAHPNERGRAKLTHATQQILK